MNNSRPRLRLGITGAALAAALLVPGTAAAETGSVGTGSAGTGSADVFNRITTAIVCMINPQSSSIAGPMGGTYPICGPGLGG